MSSSPVIIAEAVRATLAAAHAAGRVAQNISVERISVNRPSLEQLRDWTPDETETLGAIRVFVSPQDEELVPEETDRESLVFNYPIIIAIAAKPATTANANVDPLHELRTELKDYFFKTNPAYALLNRPESAIALETVNDLDQKSLREKRLFLAEFVVTFKGARPR
ncbi:MAG: hypothetical protein U0941_30025 [Planctomycetaceae bacterium]